MKTPTIAEFMTCWPQTIVPEQPLAEAHALMWTHKIRHLPVLHRGKLVGMVSMDDLHPLARRKGSAEQRVLFVGVLAGQRRDGGGQALAVPERELGDLVALPDAGALDEDLAGLVHAQLVDAAVIEHAADRLQELCDGSVGPKDGGNGPQGGRSAHLGSSA